MALDRELVGRSYPPSAVYEVGRAKLAEFAAAIGSDDAVHTDPVAARAAGYPDVIAPPTFAITVTLAAAMVVLDDPDVGIDYSRVVHGEQRFVAARPVRAGDVLTVSVTVESIRSAGGHDMVTSRSDVATVEGEHVVSAYSTLVVRGGE
jgi:acyl dehydratase